MPIWRTVRVFISSTFRDMHAERDHLVRVVFPSLRERLLPYRVELIDIDLRWGITREQAEDERVIGLCLRQSEECELFFGLLGDRYGWVPDSIPGATLERFAWLREHAGISMTEMEIRHGVLNAGAPERPAGFCFRDEAATANVPEAIRAEVYAERDPATRDRLARLKQAIRDHGCPVAGPYPCRWDDYAFDRSSGMTGRLVDLDEFGRLAEAWLWEAARFGLSEPELRAITADLEPGHELFALIRQLRPYLLSREGRLDFYHANLRPAVERRYLKKSAQRREAHVRLAKYFDGLPLSRRKVEELPWQLSQAEAWPRLAEVFADPEFLNAAWDANEFEVRERWAEIEARSPLRMVIVYRDVLDNPKTGFGISLWC